MSFKALEKETLRTSAENIKKKAKEIKNDGWHDIKNRITGKTKWKTLYLMRKIVAKKVYENH